MFAVEQEKDMERLLKLKEQFIPKLTENMSKGSCGRVGVIGGCPEYTGAPYFAGITALRTGVDICYIFTHSDAAPIIKGYSPELIVHPKFERYHEQINENISRSVRKMHSLVIGPGLSRNEDLLKSSYKLIKEAQENHVGLVIDAEGLLIVQKHPELFQSYPFTVLTPNLGEFERLCQSFCIDAKAENSVQKLASSLGNVTIILKGNEDIITNGRNTVICSSLGISRRAGGQGDLLAGSIAAFLSWMKLNNSTDPDVLLDSVWGASFLIKVVSRRAFQSHHRATSVPDMIPLISKTFFDIFDSHSHHSI